MPYLVDSDWVIPYLDDDPNALTVLNQLAGDGLAISVITYMEIYQGILATQTQEPPRQSLKPSSPPCQSCP